MNKNEAVYFIKYLVKIPFIELKKMGLWFYDEMKWVNRNKSMSGICFLLWFGFFVKELNLPANIFLGLGILLFIKSEYMKGQWKYSMRKKDEINERKRSNKYISMEELENGSKKE